MGLAIVTGTVEVEVSLRQAAGCSVGGAASLHARIGSYRVFKLRRVQRTIAIQNHHLLFSCRRTRFLAKPLEHPTPQTLTAPFLYHQRQFSEKQALSHSATGRSLARSPP
jgi:hypothetical protein